MRKKSQNILFTILIGYFGLLAIYGKDFSYLSLGVGGMRLFVGEAALALGLIWALRQLEIPKLKVPLAHLGIFLFVGAVGTAFSIYFFKSTLGLMQVLRDSALYYQSAWILVALALSREQWFKLFSVILASAALGQALAWVGPIILNFAYHTPVTPLDQLLVPYGNEVVSPLFPLAYGLWAGNLPNFLVLANGRTFFGQIFYIKKNWCFSAFALCLPTGLILSKDRRKQGVWFLASLLAALLLGVLTSPLSISERATKAYQAMPSIHSLSDALPFFSKPIEDPKGWALHGDVLRNESGTVVSPMGFRLFMWQQTWEGIKKAPILGNGFGPHMVQTHLNGTPAMVDGRWISGPHNSFLSIVFRMGLLGFIPLMGLLLYTGFWRFKENWATPLNTSTAVAFISIFLFAGYNVCLENPQAGTWFWLFMGSLIKLKTEADL